MARQGWRVHQVRRDDRRDLNRQGRRRAAGAGPAATVAELLVDEGRHGHGRAGDRPHRRGAAAEDCLGPGPAAPSPAPESASAEGPRRAWPIATAAAPKRRRAPRGNEGLACRRPRRGSRGPWTSRACRASGPGRAHRQVPTCSRPLRTREAPRRRRGASANGASAPRRRAGDPSRCARQRGGARTLHGAVALDPHGDELPHADRDDARGAAQGAQGGRAQRSRSRI